MKRLATAPYAVLPFANHKIREVGLSPREAYLMAVQIVHDRRCKVGTGIFSADNNINNFVITKHIAMADGLHRIVLTAK